MVLIFTFYVPFDNLIQGWSNVTVNTVIKLINAALANTQDIRIKLLPLYYK